MMCLSMAPITFACSEADWHLRFVHISLLSPTQLKSTSAKAGGNFMEQIRVCTYDGPGAQPVIRSVPWPKIPRKAALIKVGAEFSEDFMSKKLGVGSKVMIPPLMPCGHCYYCIHYPESANKCLTPVYYGRYLGFDKAPHLWGGWAEYVYVDLEMLP